MRWWEIAGNRTKMGDRGAEGQVGGVAGGSQGVVEDGLGSEEQEGKMKTDEEEEGGGVDW